MTCKDCKHWRKERVEWLGHCVELDLEPPNERDEAGIKLIGWDSGAIFTCGPDFGCTFFKKKEVGNELPN